MTWQSRQLNNHPANYLLSARRMREHGGLFPQIKGNLTQLNTISLHDVIPLHCRFFKSVVFSSIPNLKQDYTMKQNTGSLLLSFTFALPDALLSPLCLGGLVQDRLPPPSWAKFRRNFWNRESLPLRHCLRQNKSNKAAVGYHQWYSRDPSACRFAGM